MVLSILGEVKFVSPLLFEAVLSSSVLTQGEEDRPQRSDAKQHYVGG